LECTSESLPDWGSIPRIRPFNGPKKPVYSNDWIRLVGWVLTDGHLANDSKPSPGWDYRHSKECGYSGNMVQIGQTKAAGIAEIDGVLQRLGIPYRTKSIRKEGEHVTWHFSGEAGRWFYAVFPERMLRPEFLLQLTVPQLNILFDTMVKGDGWLDNGRENFCAGANKKKQIDAFQMLSVLCGRLVNVAYWDMRKYQETTKLYNSMTNIPKAEGEWVASIARRQNIDLAFIKREVITEKRGVWCPMVPNSFFVARRKGKVYITGNTPIQSTAADVVLEAQSAIYKLSQQVHDPYLCPRINVHDDLSFILPSDDDERLFGYIDRIGAEMVKPRFDWQIVPFSVEVKLGPNWCDMDDVAVISGSYHR
jgi:hypothetical protein